MDTTIMLNTVIILFIVMNVMWLVSLVLKDVSVVDCVWSLCS